MKKNYKKIIGGIFKGVLVCLIITSCERVIEIQEKQNTSFLSKIRVLSSNNIALNSLDVEIYYSEEHYLDLMPDTTLISIPDSPELYISDAGEYVWFRVFYNKEVSGRVCINPIQKYIIPKSFENIDIVTYEIKVDNPIIVFESVHYSYCYHSDGNKYSLIIKDSNLISKFDSTYSFRPCYTRNYKEVNYEVVDIQSPVNIELVAVETQNRILTREIIPIENIQANYVGTDNFGFNIKTIWE